MRKRLYTGKSAEYILQTFLLYRTSEDCLELDIILEILKKM